ncbi:MAG TPA: amidase [Actinomycetota bacterium]
MSDATPIGPPESAAAMVVALRSGATSSRELVERALDREQAWRSQTNAFSQVWADEALADAARVDRAMAAREELPLLAGIPVVVKDLFDVAGHETTGCCAAFAGRVADRDAVVVQRMRAAGLVLVGKANQHELAAGGTNQVSACGATGNPWDPARITGGSSGGSAAAVASGVVPWALGSDTGGSIRIPAALCGTFGLKPTWGSVSLEGAMPLAPSMDCPGPLAATAVDLWLLYEALAGSHVRVPDAGWIELPDGRAPRVALAQGFYEAFVHPDVAAAVARAAEALAGAGVEVTSIDGRGIEDSRGVWSRVCFPEFDAAHPDLRSPPKRAQVAPSVLEWLDRGHAYPEQEIADAAARRTQIAAWYRERLAGFDAMLIPTCPYPAPPAGASQVDLGANGMVETDTVGPGFITCTVNLAGLPAVNLPAGRASDGLPVGVSLVGLDGHEETLCRLAARWEAATS